MKKTNTTCRAALALLAGAALFAAGCGNAAGPKKAAPGAGERLVRVALVAPADAGGVYAPARTIVPPLPEAGGELRYRLCAEDQIGGKEDVVVEAETVTNVELVLRESEWVIHADAYIGEWEADPLIIAMGDSDPIIVNAATSTLRVTIALSPNTEADATGTLDLSIAGAAFEEGSHISITNIDTGEGVTGTFGALVFDADGEAPLTAAAEQTLSLAGGRYLVSLVLCKADGTEANQLQVVEIWPSLTSELAFDISAGQYYDPLAIVAAQGGAYFKNLQSALDAAVESSGTVELLHSTAIPAEGIRIPGGVTLQTYGYDLSSDTLNLRGAFNSSAGVTVKPDSVEDGALVISANAVLTVKAGEEATLYNAVLNANNETSNIVVGVDAVLHIVAESGLAGLATTLSNAGTGLAVGPGDTYSVVAGCNGLPAASGTYTLTLNGKSDTAEKVRGVFSVVEDLVYQGAPNAEHNFVDNTFQGEGSITLAYTEDVYLDSGADHAVTKIDSGLTWGILEDAGFSFTRTYGGSVDMSGSIAVAYDEGSHTITFTYDDIWPNNYQLEVPVLGDSLHNLYPAQVYTSNDTIAPHITGAFVTHEDKNNVRVEFSEPVNLTYSDWTMKVNTMPGTYNTDPPNGIILDINATDRNPASAAVISDTHNKVWNLATGANGYAEILRLKANAAGAQDAVGHSMPGNIPQYIVRNTIRRYDTKPEIGRAQGLYAPGSSSPTNADGANTFYSAMNALNSITTGTYTIVLTENQTFDGALFTGTNKSDFTLIITTPGDVGDITISVANNAATRKWIIARTGTTIIIDEHIIIKRASKTTSDIDAPVCAYEGGRIIMDGGEITNNQAQISGGSYNSVKGDETGGIRVAGSTVGAFFIMNGGKIWNNAAISSCTGDPMRQTSIFGNYGFNMGGAGGVHLSNYAYFVMHGGEISGNSASMSSYLPHAGAVYATVMRTGSNTSSSTGAATYQGAGAFFMTGGLIQNNSLIDSRGCARAGGILVGGCFQKTGGTVTGNAATGTAGNVHAQNIGVVQPFATAGGVNPTGVASLDGAAGPDVQLFIDGLKPTASAAAAVSIAAWAPWAAGNWD
jgi:hypothetical protein